MTTASPYTLRPAFRPDGHETLCDQLPLFGPGIRDAFERYHAEHPEVYAALLRMAYRAQAAGYESWSVDAMFHILRWETAIITGNPDGFKLNCHHTAYYARLLNAEPGLEGMFRIRELRG